MVLSVSLFVLLVVVFIAAVDGDDGDFSKRKPRKKAGKEEWGSKSDVFSIKLFFIRNSA